MFQADLDILIGKDKLPENYYGYLRNLSAAGSDKAQGTRTESDSKILAKALKRNSPSAPTYQGYRMVS